MKASPEAVKVNGGISVHLEADLDVGFGKAKATPKKATKAAKSKKTAVTTMARTAKGKGTMNTLINAVTKNGGQGMVVAGEMRPTES